MAALELLCEIHLKRKKFHLTQTPYGHRNTSLLVEFLDRSGVLDECNGDGVTEREK